MTHGERSPKQYEFQVVTTTRMRVIATDGGRARDAVKRALDGSAATLVTGSGSGLELLYIHLAGPITMTSVDGVDPLAALEDALKRYAARDGDKSSA